MTDEVCSWVHKTLAIFLRSRVVTFGLLEALFETHYPDSKLQIMAKTAISEEIMTLLLKGKNIWNSGRRQKMLFITFFLEHKIKAEWIAR